MGAGNRERDTGTIPDPPSEEESQSIISRILAGTMSPADLMGNSRLYSMASRIYGKEALEDMGIKPPKIDMEIQSPRITDNTGDISLPEKRRSMDGEAIESEDDAIISEVSTLKRGLAEMLTSKRMRRWLFIGISIRFILAPWTTHLTDVAVHYLAVMDMLNGNSPYASLDYPYPPIYPMLLYPIFLVASLFSDPITWGVNSSELEVLSSNVALSSPILTSPLFNFLVKLPLIMSDICSGIVIYCVCRVIGNRKVAEDSTIFWFLNPLGIWVSSVIGQCDSLLVTFLLLTIWNLIKERWEISGILFALSVFTKGYSLPIGVFLLCFILLYGHVSREEIRVSMFRAASFSVYSIITAFSLLLFMLYGNGGAIFVRRYSASIQPGGISPFVLKHFYPLRETVGDKDSLIPNLVSSFFEFGSLFRLQYVSGIIVCGWLYYHYRRTLSEREVWALCLALGVSVQSYLCIFLIGRVNPQYMLLIMAMFATTYPIINDRSKFMGIMTSSSALISLFGITVVSWNYDLIPLAAHTGIADFSSIVESTTVDWSKSGIFSEKARTDRGIIFGFSGWLLTTWGLLVVLLSSSRKRIVGPGDLEVQNQLEVVK